MGSYIIRRVLLIIPTLIISSLLIFCLIRLIPGSVIDKIVIQRQAYEAVDRQIIAHQLGLDVPIYKQYFRWIGGILLHGDFGTSILKNTPVTKDLMERWPITFELGVLGMIFGLIIAIPIGIYSAMRQDSIGDYLGRSFAVLCLAIPNFWLATLVIILPAIWWNWSPPIKLVPFIQDPLANLQMFIIPSMILGAGLAGITMRMTRTMMLEVLRQDYVRTAWAKGLKERVIVMRHALKNALIPTITIIGLQLPVLIGGEIIIEKIFVLPGIGLLMLNAVTGRDYPVVVGVMIFIAIGTLAINLLVDLCYGLVDPRVHYQ